MPSRVGLLTSLERRGWSPEELAACAAYEEAIFDDLLTVDDFEYIDDDLELLIVNARSLVDSATSGRVLKNGQPMDDSEELARTKKNLAFFERLRRDGIPTTLEANIAKTAFRQRALNDAIRLHIVESDRAQLRAGYSLGIQFTSEWSRPFEEYGFEGIRWDSTLGCAMAHDESASGPVLRVPGLILRADLVTPSRTLRPAEYDRAWREYDIDGYLAAWAKLNGQRRCANCFEQLPAKSNTQKRFCDSKCRNAAKQRRYRARNPDAAEAAKRRYWSSISDDD